MRPFQSLENLMHFDLIDLRLYLHILDSGNITAGAARSHLSLLPPAHASEPWSLHWASRFSSAAAVA